MTVKEFTIQSLSNHFRVKKMNAIELLALRAQIDFDDYKKTEKLYELILNNIEVEFNGQWLPIREERQNGQADYYPVGIEDDADAISELIQYFLKEVLMPVFMKSNVSN